MQDKVQLISSKNNMSHNNKKEYQQTNINKNRLPQTFKRNAPASHRKKSFELDGASVHELRAKIKTNMSNNRTNNSLSENDGKNSPDRQRSPLEVYGSNRNSWIQDPSALNAKENILHQEQERKRYISYAGIVAKGGVHGRSHSETIPDNIGIRVAKFYHGSIWRQFYVFVAVINMILASWEHSTTIAGVQVDNVNHVTGLIRSLDLICLAIFSFDIFLLYLYKGKAEFLTMNVKVRIGLISTMGINTMICLIWPDAPHISRILRPFILVERLRNVRKIFFAIVESTPKIFNVLLILFLHILFFGTMGHLIFRGIDDTVLNSDGTCVGIFAKDITHDVDIQTSSGSSSSSSSSSISSAHSTSLNASTNITNVTTTDTHGIDYHIYCSTYNGVCTDYFNSLSASLLQMFILITTANYPDIMMPVYRCSNYTAIFFATFLILGLYILMSLVLAVIYTHFASRSKAKYKEFFTTRNNAFRLAHGLLYRASFFSGGTNAESLLDRPSSCSTINRKVDRSEENVRKKKDQKIQAISNNKKKTASNNHDEQDTLRNIDTTFRIGVVEWTDMCHYINPKMPVEIAQAIFWSFDKTDTGLMSLRKFSMAMRFASLRVTMVTNSTIMRKGNDVLRISKLPNGGKLPKTFTSCKIKVREFMRKVTGYKYFDAVFDLLIIANGVIILMIAMQNELTLPEADVKTLDSISEAMAYVFAVEVTSKIIALGFKKFWRVSWFNRIDFVTMQLSLSIIVFDKFYHLLPRSETATGEGSPRQLGTAALLARLVRIFRIMDNNAAFRRLTNTIVHVIPALWRFFGILCVVVYMYAIVGMEIFGKRLSVERLKVLYPNDPGRVELFKNSSFYRLNYMENNFDDFPHAIVTLFEQLVVNNWPIVMEGAIAATGWLASLYFISFYLISVVCIMNVLVAFLIDAYQAKEVLIEQDGGDERKNDAARLEDSFRNMSENRIKLPEWHRKILDAADRHGCDISLWKLRLKESTGEMYGSLYRDDEDDKSSPKRES
jgi:hypothetical protein